MSKKHNDAGRVNGDY